MSQTVDKRLILLVLISLAGVLVILYSTRWGVGMGHDQLGYIQGAQNLVGGQGYSHFTPLGELKPTLQWPPLYSLTLTLPGFIGINIFEGARWLNALLFGLNILMVGYIAYLKTDLWTALFGAFLMLTSTVTLYVHAMAFSEPLFISLGLAGLYFLDRYLVDSRTSLLILSALAMGAATLTRYMGVTLIATLCLGILFFGKRALRRRFVDCLSAGLVASLPLLLWIVRNRLVTGKTSSRQVEVHLIKLSHLQEGLYTIALWVLPARIVSNSKALVLFAVIMVTGSVLSIAWLRQRGALTFLYLNVMYVLLYCLGLVFFISFVSLDLAFDTRYLSPVFVSLVLILTLCIHRLTFRKGKPIVIAVTVVCVLFSCFYVVRAVPFVRTAHQEGLGWASPSWTDSELVKAVKSLPPDALLYANYATGIAYLSQRKIADLPIKFDEHTENPAGDYLDKLRAIAETSRSQRTAIIYTNWLRPHFLSEHELQQTFALKKVVSTPHGSIFEVSGFAKEGAAWRK